MSKKDERMFWNIVAVIVVFALIVWFLSQVIDLMKQNPQPVWFIFGIIVTLAIEAVIYFGVNLFRRVRGY